MIEAVKEILEANNWVWNLSNDSGDLYEDETGFHHKALNFIHVINV